MRLPDFFANEAGVLLEGGNSLFVGNAEGFVRLNLAMPRSILKTGMERMAESIEKYKKEADISQLNDTPSRQKIIDENDHIYETDTEEYISILKTITTKQDRNPNSGVIEYNYKKTGKFNYRYLTARECIIAMGFDEADYDALAEYNASKNSLRDVFSEGKIIKMAGNSIVVNVLEAIFGQVDYINKNIL